MFEIPIGMAGAADRIRRLEQLSLKAERAGDLVLVAKCLELAASERRAVPCGVEAVGLPPLTPEQARLEIEEFLTKRMAEHERGESEGRID